MSYSNKKTIGLFGCSNLYGYHYAFMESIWNEDKMFCLNAYLDQHVYNKSKKTEYYESDTYIIKNYAFPGCGNKFIHEMVKQEIANIDYLFVQFTGLTRLDTAGTLSNFPFQNNNWIFSGGVNGYWKQNKNSRNIFRSLYKKNLDVIVDENLSLVYKTVDLIEKNNKKYNWCFYYDVEQSNQEDHSPVTLNKNDNFISPDPHSYCFSIGKGSEDGIHFMYDGYKQWLNKIKHELNIPVC